MEKIHSVLTKKWIAFAIATLFAIYGSIFAWVAHDHILGMGDQATFYTFAHNLSQGESIYEDFIHFRMPGSYFIHALGIKAFGDKQASVSLMLTFESTVLFPLCLFASIFLLFWRSKWLTPLMLIAAFGLAVFPHILQLRSGLALLAVSFYVASGYWKWSLQKRAFLVGVLLGISLMFGQETTLMALIAIGASEIIQSTKSLEYAILARTVGLLIIGGIVGALPLLIYSIFWSDFSAFMYYTLYYAFVLQPKFMDLPYPELSSVSIEYYLPFAIYLLTYLTLYMSRWRYRFAAGVVLSFIILRLITLLGRSDWGHLMFAIPEMITLIPITYYLIIKSKFIASDVWRFMPYGIVVLIIFALAIGYKSAVLVLVPFVILWSLRDTNRKSSRKESRLLPGVILTVFTMATFLMAYTTKDYFIMTSDLLREEVTIDDSKRVRIEGIKADPVTYAEINDVKELVEPLYPRTIFSFPIQPFYYSLADNHATRFMTFEPQTTIEEQHQTIDDLNKNKPGVIIFDPVQASALSGSLWLISNYITEHYQVIGVVEQNTQLWVMSPKSQYSADEKITLNLNHVLAKNNYVPMTIYNEKLGIKNALFVENDTEIPYETKEHTKLRLSVAIYERLSNETPLANCGVFEVIYKDSRDMRKVCASDGIVDVSVKSQSSISIKLSGSVANPVVWNDVTLTK